MFNIRELLHQMRFGIAVSALVVIGTALYAEIHGPLYGVWGWPELAIGGLILSACMMAAIEAAVRQPNPYTRTYVLYNLSDVSPNRDLESGGTGWMIQALPSVVIAILLGGIFWLT